MNMIDDVLYGDETGTPRPPQDWQPHTLRTIAYGTVGIGLALLSFAAPVINAGGQLVKLVRS